MDAAPLVEREEVVALLFNVSDIAQSLRNIECCWRKTMAKRKLTEADHQRLERMRMNAERTRALAEKAQAELDRRKQQHTHQ